MKLYFFISFVGDTLSFDVSGAMDNGGTTLLTLSDETDPQDYVDFRATYGHGFTYQIYALDGETLLAEAYIAS